MASVVTREHHKSPNRVTETWARNTERHIRIGVNY